MRFTRTKAIIAATGLALSLAACGGDDETPEVEVASDTDFEAGTTMAEIAEAGTVTVGTKFDQPGFGLQNLEGEPEGFDVEVAKIIAGAMGIAPEDIEWKESTSDIREQVIEDGEVDFVVATYTINDERKERITFAGPYYEAGQMLMVAEDNDSIEGPEDLADNPDAKVCSVTGSTPSENIKEYLASEDQLVLFDVYDKCADALDNGQVDVVTTDNVILLGFVDESEGAFKLVGEQFTEEPYGIGIEKGDVEFCEFINETLAENEDAYLEAWEATAGQVEGTETPELPEPDACA
ncbi:glutamate ABC transporter substrate-binding protein [Nocardioides ganghwensis]|jgi:glutamate transport system substrate-binding protein|uniref:Glutamate ABC transporter substrate-binding protein n=1 Tax=Nocardioides ganghwensis TaxID=252230 RepID=A0A4Q2SBG5_9ACTN|nr:glutamate ABC transporter substrate-binding protein [Nocardioides ganghwensis]MBD3944007.1 glutamate ABC transporter substrate-binding protein [Nocardioides ganghwensis]RYC01557.1 glutamate ABC transporter substrate-binding protein [Nocardioides ganghwensis]